MKRSIINFSILFYSSVVLLSFSGCKKGEDDPAVSLRSRKARVEGEWKVAQMENTQSYTKEYDSGADSSSVTTINFDGTTYTASFETSSETDLEEMKLKGQATGPASITFSLKKDGAFTSIETREVTANTEENFSSFLSSPHSVTTYKTEKITRVVKGKWNFINGIEGTKNKSNVAITYSEEEILTEAAGYKDYNFGDTIIRRDFTINNSDYVYYNDSNIDAVWYLEQLEHKAMTVVTSDGSTGRGNISDTGESDGYTVNSSGSGRIILSQK